MLRKLSIIILSLSLFSQYSCGNTTNETNKEKENQNTTQSPDNPLANKQVGSLKKSIQSSLNIKHTNYKDSILVSEIGFTLICKLLKVVSFAL